jgi:hypothetical protein
MAVLDLDEHFFPWLLCSTRNSFSSTFPWKDNIGNMMISVIFIVGQVAKTDIYGRTVDPNTKDSTDPPLVEE